MSNALNLGGRSAIVVGGGGGGIGTAVVDVLAAAGADVGAITYVDEHAEDTRTRVEKVGQRAATRVVDVTDEDALRQAMREVIDELGPVQHLVNVVGGALVDDWDRVEELRTESWDRVLGRNVHYALVSCQEVARPLLERGEPGSIVNISSVAARGAPLLGAYAAGKGALESISRTMALEWGPKRLRVNLVAPGTIKTPRAGTDDLEDSASTIPLRRRGTPADIANAALFLLSDLADYITGQTIVCDGGTSISGGSGGQELPVFVTNPAVRARFD